MVVGVCRVELSVPGSLGIKDKRNRLRPIMQLLQKEYHLAVAEVGDPDDAERVALGFAAVGNDRRIINSLIDKIVARLEETADVVVLSHDFEITNYGA